ncbi:hypothetical protein QR680_001008 [Steinernema hermaphroditum]|uniref:Uncharacterized protein n=1 Tax=Steinernema hermaphroditum TaxID=289476 RepID=A0AA39GY84_9BILA|nr:hypothetical protein QR680_001008 [Steinernema hermaphroditum]
MKRKQQELEEASKELAYKLSQFPEPFHFASIHPLTKLGHHLPFPEEDMRSSFMLPVMNFEIGDIEMKSIEQEEFSAEDYIPDLVRQVNDFNIDNFTIPERAYLVVKRYLYTVGLLSRLLTWMTWKRSIRAKLSALRSLSQISSNQLL